MDQKSLTRSLLYSDLCFRYKKKTIHLKTLNFIYFFPPILIHSFNSRFYRDCYRPPNQPLFTSLFFFCYFKHPWTIKKSHQFKKIKPKTLIKSKFFMYSIYL